MLARLGEIAKERGLAAVEIPFSPTPRNRPAQSLLKSVGAAYEQSSSTGSRFLFPAETLARVTYRTAKPTAGDIQDRGPRAGAAVAPSRPDYAAIARNLRTPVQILEAVRASSRRRSAGTPADVPRSPLEKQLAQMWANLLGLPSVGIHQNFFDLGGHSLLAVQLLSLVRQTFDLDLSLKVVYSGDFTVAELAKAIELREIEQAGAGSYAEILKELESLSDEEVRALLAREQNGGSGNQP
jgi:acyl carrier protein